MEDEWQEISKTEDYIQRRIENENKPIRTDKQGVAVEKIDIKKDSKSNKVRSLKTIVSQQIFHITVDSSSPKTFLNWTTVKQIFFISTRPKILPAEKI